MLRGEIRHMLDVIYQKICSEGGFGLLKSKLQI